MGLMRTERGRLSQGLADKRSNRDHAGGELRLRGQRGRACEGQAGPRARRRSSAGRAWQGWLCWWGAPLANLAAEGPAASAGAQVQPRPGN